MQVLPLGLLSRGDVLGGPPDETGERGQGGPVAGRRALEGLQEPEPLERRTGSEHRSAAADDGGHSDPVQRVAHQYGVAVDPHEHSDVAGMQRRLRRHASVAAAGDDGRACVEELDDLGGDVASDEPTGVAGLRQALRRREGDEPVVRVHDAHAHRHWIRRAEQTGREVGRRRSHAAVGNARKPQLRFCEECVVGLEQTFVAAPIHVKGPLRLHDLARLEVGVYVSTTEGVNGLLGVADEDQGRSTAAERLVHDVPLHRIGVLEFIDQDDVVAVAKSRARCSSALGVDQRVAQPHEDVVVGQDLQVALPSIHLRPDRVGETATDGWRIKGIGPRRHDFGVGMVEHVLGDLHRVGAGETEGIRAGSKPAQVKVVHDFFHEVTHVLDECDLAVHVTRRAQSVKHLEAEPMRRLDGGRVEVGDGLAESIPAGGDLVTRCLRQELYELVGLVADGPIQHVDESVVGAHEAITHALAQLAGGHAGEGDDEEPIDRQDPLGDVACRQGRNRERLASPGACLQQRHSARKVASHHERLRLRRSSLSARHRSTTRSWVKSWSHSRAA